MLDTFASLWILLSFVISYHFVLVAQDATCCSFHAVGVCTPKGHILQSNSHCEAPSLTTVTTGGL